ncbi:MAG TPA: hypothetical protein V6D47_02510 [Oscillatoriaceae cyanobacterium]
MKFLKKLLFPVLTAAMLIGGAISAPDAHAKTHHAVTATPTPGATARARDAKGRFVSSKKAKTAKTVQKSKTARKLPPRDAKGRFIKASPTPTPAPGTTARDAKGRFVGTKKAKKSHK